jgi:hypothetical protein
LGFDARRGEEGKVEEAASQGARVEKTEFRLQERYQKL